MRQEFAWNENWLRFFLAIYAYFIHYSTNWNKKMFTWLCIHDEYNTQLRSWIVHRVYHRYIIITAENKKQSIACNFLYHICKECFSWWFDDDDDYITQSEHLQIHFIFLKLQTLVQVGMQLNYQHHCTLYTDYDTHFKSADDEEMVWWKNVDLFCL